MFLNGTIGLLLATSLGSAMDLLYFTISSVIEEYLRIINEKFCSENFEVKDVVTSHLKAINWIRVFNRILIPFIVTLYFTTAIAICIIGYQIIKVSKWFRQFKKNFEKWILLQAHEYSRIFFLLTLFARTFLYNYMSQSIRNQVNFL